VQGGQRSNLYYLQTFEDEQIEVQLDMDQKEQDIDECDPSNAEPNNLNVNDSYQASISIDLPTVGFKELLVECVSRPPCHEGIP
jgi:hypothetical protein